MSNWFKTLFTNPPTQDSADPFAHPDIARMSPRELADLPMVAPPVQPRLHGRARSVARGALSVAS